MLNISEMVQDTYTVTK